MLTDVKMTTSRKSKPFGYVAIQEPHRNAVALSRSETKLRGSKPEGRIFPCSRGAYEMLRTNPCRHVEIVDGKVCLARGER